MITKKIRIRTRKGDIIVRRAVVVDWTDGPSTDQVGIHLYKVTERDSIGAIFSVSK